MTSEVDWESKYLKAEKQLQIANSRLTNLLVHLRHLDWMMDYIETNVANGNIGAPGSIARTRLQTGINAVVNTIKEARKN